MLRLATALLSVTLAHATQRPIIAILALPIEDECVTYQGLETPSGAAPTSCFHSLYVKWLEAAGARVAPLRYDAPAAEFDALLGQVNGTLITGGETVITDLSSPYMRAAGRLYNYALTSHGRGETWPLWGTCMGMQVLSVLGAADGRVLLSNAYDAESILLPLSTTAAAKSSRLLCKGCLPAPALDALVSKNVTVNLHHDGVAPDSFAAGSRLGGAFTILSQNVDRKGKEFVSTIEATGGAPVWGAQWHPERPQFEWAVAGGPDFMTHGYDAVSSMWAVAAFFVEQCRRSSHRFASTRAEAKALIYNFRPEGDTSYQAYLF